MPGTSSAIIEHYNKFNEDKRLKSRHGQVEFLITMEYIQSMLGELGGRCTRSDAYGLSDRTVHMETAMVPGSGADGKGQDVPLKILDIGAGTGAYSIPLAEEGYQVTAVELVKHNLQRLKQKSGKVIAKQGNALNLSRLEKDSFDLVLCFGPMYHLFTFEEKCRALEEAKRVLKPGGFLMTAYYMNDYGVIMYGLKEGHLLECKSGYRLDDAFHCHSKEEDLYDFVTLEDIDRLNRQCGLQRKLIFSPDGPTNYIRPVLKGMTAEEFSVYLEYVRSIAQRPDLLGAAAHTVDVVTKGMADS